METLESLSRKRESAAELGAVVKTLKAIAASGISQYEAATASLRDYYNTIRLGLLACLKQNNYLPDSNDYLSKKEKTTCILVFGSDQGLVGQFNESLCSFLQNDLRGLKHQKTIWVTGERMYNLLLDSGIHADRLFAVPNSVSGITPLVGKMLTDIETARAKGPVYEVLIFHNQPKTRAGYQSVRQRLLPMDDQWVKAVKAVSWPSRVVPQVAGNVATVLQALIKEYLFVSVYKACAESLTSENESRLEAMERAEKSIGELLVDLNSAYNRLRQNAIDEELFDVISGFESLKKNNI